MLKIFLVISMLFLSCFASQADATLPLDQRQQLIHERAIKRAEARRKRIELGRSSHYQYRYPPLYTYPTYLYRFIPYGLLDGHLNLVIQRRWFSRIIIVDGIRMKITLVTPYRQLQLLKQSNNFNQ